MNGQSHSIQLSLSAARALSTPGAGRQLLAPADPVLQTRYRELTRKHVGRFADRLFSEFTGLHFHIAWAPSLPHDWTARRLPTGCSVCCQLAGTTVESQASCLTCGPKQLASALSANGAGHQFTCRLGVRNYWFPIRLRGLTVGVAYVQALAGSRAFRLGPRRQARNHRRLGNPLPHAEAQPLSRSAFNRAARLLRFFIQHVQTSCLADLRKADLTKARQALVDFGTAQARMRRELNRLNPAIRQIAVQPVMENHTQRTLHQLLVCVHQNYAQPLTLQQCSADLARNAAYLSALFSRVVGMPFKAYLTEVRMEKAKELLSDPLRTIAGVASSVGYVSENRFRIAFKKVTGLPPRIWRETLRLPFAGLLVWLLEDVDLLQTAELLLPL